MSSTRLELWDYVSMSCVIALSCVVGLYHIYTARKSKKTEDFLVTSRHLGLFPLIVSVVATFYSAVGMLGLPVETYTNGVSFQIITLPFFLLLPFGCLLYVPVFYKLNRMSIFEYLELRFSYAVRITASVIISIETLFYTACVIYAPALALNQVTGLDMWTSVISVGVACIIYTSMGGIKAVVWADVTQCLVMVGVVLVIAVKGCVDVGGFHALRAALRQGERDRLFIWSSSPYSQYSLWTALGATVHALSYMIINQAMMQRYLSNKTLQRAQISLMGGAIGIAVGHVIIPFCGLLIYAHYRHCDPLISGLVSKSDQLMALFAVEILSFCRGLPGLFVAGILCGSLSTLSSTLNSLTAVTLSDYIKPLKPQLSDRMSMKLSKILVVLYGGLCIALVATAEQMGGVLKLVYVLHGLAGGPVFALFTIGMLYPWVNTKSAVVAFGASAVFSWWAFLGNFFTAPPLNHAPYSIEGCVNVTLNDTRTSHVQELSVLQQFYTIPALWFACWSLVVGLVVAPVASKIIGSQDPKQVDCDLLFSFMKKYGKQKQDCKLDLDQPEEEEKLHPLLTYK